MKIDASSVQKVAAAMQLAAQQLTLRQVKSLMGKHALPGELTGRGTNWELEVPDERAMRLVKKLIPGLGGFRSGHGSWLLSQSYQTSDDWNNPASQHHYAAHGRVAGGNGWQIMQSLLDYKKLVTVHRSLHGADDQSADLLQEVMHKIGDELDMSRGVHEALSRLRQIANTGSRMDPAMLRNSIFKAANSLGIKLPSGMFASDKTAAITLREIGQINRMTDDNDHNGSMVLLAQKLGMRKHTQIFTGIEMISNAMGETPNALYTLRQVYSKQVYAKTKTIKIKLLDGKQVTLYELLD